LAALLTALLLAALAGLLLLLARLLATTLLTAAALLTTLLAALLLLTRILILVLVRHASLLGFRPPRLCQRRHRSKVAWDRSPTWDSSHATGTEYRSNFMR